MTAPKSKWGRFIDFAAIVHGLLIDAQTKMAEASLIDPITPDVVDQLNTVWNDLTINLAAFTEISAAIEHSKELTPEEVIMAISTIGKINEAARETDASLRLFFQTTGLASQLPSRNDSGEGLKIQ